MTQDGLENLKHYLREDGGIKIKFSEAMVVLKNLFYGRQMRKGMDSM